MLNCTFNFNRFIDIHSHILPYIDDGASSDRESDELINLEKAQGTRHIFLTSHSRKILKSPQKYWENYENLCQRYAGDKDIKFYPGTEIYCSIQNIDNIINQLEGNVLFGLNNTRYILVEFNAKGRGVSYREIRYCIKKLLENDWIPVIAHVEKYRALYKRGSIQFVEELKDLGCLIQINTYSICNDRKRKKIVNKLIKSRLVDFLGTDAHRIYFRLDNKGKKKVGRKPIIKEPLEYLYDCFDKEYIDKIAYKNAENILLNVDGKGDANE